MFIKRLICTFLVAIIVMNLSCVALAAINKQDTLAELDENNVFVEPIDIEDLPFDVESSARSLLRVRKVMFLLSPLTLKIYRLMLSLLRVRKVIYRYLIRKRSLIHR